MALSLVIAPAIEPITLVEAKLHLRVDSVDEDNLIDGLRVTANEHVEDVTHRAGIARTYDYKVNGFPGWYCPIELPKPPLISVTSVTYIDAAGVSQTWSAALYTVLNAADAQLPGSIVPIYGGSYPATRDVPNAVTVRFVAGYGTTAETVPGRWKSAMKILIAHWFDPGRDAVNVGHIVTEVPRTVDALLWPLKAF